MVIPTTPETPVVNGAPTKLLTLTHADLALSPLREPLPRFRNSAHMVAEISREATIYVLLEDATGRILGSVTDEPYDESKPSYGDDDAQAGEAHTPGVFTPTVEGDPFVEYRRVLRLLVVDPSLHRTGVGSWFMRFLEAKLVESARAKALTHVHWVLSTVQEVNSAYYLHRGWKIIKSVPEHFGGTLPANVVTMDKLVAVDSE